MANQGEHKQEATISPEVIAALSAIAKREARQAEKEEKADLAEKEKQIQRVKEMQENAQMEESVRKAKRLGCQHARYNNGSRFPLWVGQVNSDGYVRPVCLECQTEMPRFKANDQMIKDGANLHLYKTLDVPTLEGWHKISFPKGCEASGCHVCHPVAVSA